VLVAARAEGDVKASEEVSVVAGPPGDAVRAALDDADLRRLIEEARADERAAVVSEAEACTHPAAVVAYYWLDGASAQVGWCAVCGSFNDQGEWTAPSRAARASVAATPSVRTDSAPAEGPRHPDGKGDASSAAVPRPSDARTQMFAPSDDPKTTAQLTTILALRKMREEEEQRPPEASPPTTLDGFVRTEPDRDHSAIHCVCGATFTWTGFDKDLAPWIKTHEEHRPLTVEGRERLEGRPRPNEVQIDPETAAWMNAPMGPPPAGVTTWAWQCTCGAVLSVCDDGDPERAGRLLAESRRLADLHTATCKGGRVTQASTTVQPCSDKASSDPSALADYVVRFLRRRARGAWRAAIELSDAALLRDELEWIFTHGGHPPNWVPDRQDKTEPDWRDLAAAAYTAWLDGDHTSEGTVATMRAIAAACLAAPPRSANARHATPSGSRCRAVHPGEGGRCIYGEGHPIREHTDGSVRWPVDDAEPDHGSEAISFATTAIRGAMQHLETTPWHENDDLVMSNLGEALRRLRSPRTETATSDVVLELRSAMCGRCGAIGGTHGRPCIDDSAFMAQLEEWGLKVRRAAREKGEAGR
jgi:hypothetical protein